MINLHAQALGKLGGLANRGKAKSQAHKDKLAASLAQARTKRGDKRPTVERSTTSKAKPVERSTMPVEHSTEPLEFIHRDGYLQKLDKSTGQYEPVKF